MNAHGQGTYAIDSIERRVLDYLASHPHAADSAEGIRRWWLGSQGATATPEEIEQALARLVDGGLMRRVSLADGTRLYASEQEHSEHHVAH
ncbi:hypothetical protein [Variovorax sp. JS1663]|uniref:hypothetical protein n=1 Tax=Variovorax sp. JS1663 TaxID=1851577 RepID=UPI000B347C8A|nr:hypothetical protein [Variovorax sp. JS1663]OUL98526.1 hypothetical protein A8M77_31175 [Variovorax sp. JS1663]